MLKSFKITKTEAKKIPLYLCLLGINHIQEPVHRPQGVPMSQFLYCTKGSGELIINNQKSIVKPGEIIFISKKTPHTYRAIEDNWTMQIMGFDGEVSQRLLAILRMTESGVYSCKNPKFFIDGIKKMDRLSEKEGPEPKLTYSTMIYDLLLQLSTNISKVPSTEKVYSNELVTNVLNYLESNYEKDISLTELASELGRTPEYLCSIFKKETGQTIIQALTSIRLVQARIMLGRYPEKKVAEIGRLCGFRSPSYFCKVFQKNFNVTPNEYRTF